MLTVTRFGSRDSRMRPTASAKALVVVRVDDRTQADREVDPLGARRLGDDVEPELAEEVADVERDACAVDDVRRRAGIEVEHHGSGTPRVGGARLGSVELERSEVRRPHERRQVVDAAGADLGVGVERDGGEPVRTVAGAPLLEEPLALDAVGEPDHGDRAVLQVRQHRRGDAGVVVDHLAFGEAVRGVQDLVEVGEPQPAAVHLDQRFGARPSRTLGPTGHDLRR